jgi:hypothetical protein
VEAPEFVEKARRAFDDLNERERKLLVLLVSVTAAILVLLPLYLVGSSVSDIEEENQLAQDVLRDIARSRDMLAERQAEREAAQQLYANKAPALGGWIESQANAQSIALRDVTDQPEVVLGNYTRRNIRAALPHVGIRPVVKMLTEISNSPYPVIIERIEVDNVRGAEDYNIRIGVSAYDRGVPQRDEEGGEGPTRSKRR